MITKRDRRLAYQRSVSARLRNRARALIIKAKARPCCDCNTAYPHYIMDFDHVRGERKIANIGASASKWQSDLESLQAEIDKCDVVCANCHRERTHGPKAKENREKREAVWEAQKQGPKRTFGKRPKEKLEPAKLESPIKQYV